MTAYVSTPIAGVNGNTQTLTVGSVTNGLLVVSIGWRDAEDIPGVTWDGTPLTKAVSEWESRGSNSRNSAIWYLVGPAAKTASLIIDHLDDAFTIVSATVFSGVDQTTPIRSTGSDARPGGSFPLNAIVTTVAGDHVFCRYQGSTSSSLSTSTATKIWEANPASSTNAGFRDTASSTSYTFDITGSGGANRHTACAISIIAASPDVTLALTGVSASSTRGTFSVLTQTALTGVDAAGGVGTIALSTEYFVALTGSGASGSVGNLFTGGNVTLGLTGVSTTVSTGLLTTAGGIRGTLIDSPRIRTPSFTLPATGFFSVGAVLANTTATNPSGAYGGTWTLLGTQSIGAATVSYYERTA